MRKLRRRAGMAVLLVAAVWGSMAVPAAKAGDGPDPIFEKPAAITTAELAQKKIDGVAAVEVSDYLLGAFKGEVKPGAPHADLNPKRAVVIAWEENQRRFVFSHEASYCPVMELENGVALCNQFFEGNAGWAELFNASGRRERNSFVDIIRSGPDWAWVRWTYFCVNMTDDSKPALRATEDYIAYPNGLVWRRMTYASLMPDKFEGYSWSPIEFFSIIPAGVEWPTLLPRDSEHGDYHIFSALDAYSDKRYDLYWADPRPKTRDFGVGQARRTGDAALLKQIAQSPGYAVVMPFEAGCLFSIVGEAGGIPREKSQLADQSFVDTGGCGWISWELDHWPIGWTNSQGNTRQPSSPYPYCICPLGHYITDKWLDRYTPDYDKMTQNMEHNKWAERHIFYMVIGAGGDFDSIRRLARQWLDKGKDCARAESIAGLRSESR